jgi:hypothetical protein
MTSKDLKAWQYAQLRTSIAPKLRYFARLHDRVFKLGVGTDDPLLVAARDAHHAVFSLFTDARIPWPIGQPKGIPAKSLIIFSDLADAVRCESNQAVCHWWGVTPQTVTKWRKALGVGRRTAGSTRLRHDYFLEPWVRRAQAKAHDKARDPKRRAKIVASKTGKKRPPEVVKAMRQRMLGAKLSADTRRKMSKSHRARGTRPPAAGVPWTAAEDKLLRRLPAAEVAQRTGRTLAAVCLRRQKLGTPDGRRR